MANFYTQAGFTNNLHINNSPSFYIQRTIENGTGKLTKDGSLVVTTGKHTGRSANDRYIVFSETTENTVWWDNNLNKMSSEEFTSLKNDVLEELKTKKDLYITERLVGACSTHNIGARLISSSPHHALFTYHLFRDSHREMTEKDFTILHLPEFNAPIKKYGNERETIVATCFDTKTTIIVGTFYAGEIKKSMFSVMNYDLTEDNVLPMHTGAAELPNGSSSLFFGLSGTGKTTLSTDEGTLLIGDDEHGLSDKGVFNFEGGCYAKTYELSFEKEPEIYKASNQFGALLENVTFDQATGRVDFNSKEITENGRASYPLSFIDERKESSTGSIPKNIFFLTADAFGVLPPVSKLDTEQAMFYFVLGYTAKLAGTEIGIKEPQATFSPCFGAPFMLRHPEVYAKLLGEYIKKYDINVWLVNTGWTKGPYGTGERFPLQTTRNIIRAIQNNELETVPFEKDPIFGLSSPLEVRDIPQNQLNALQSWDNQDAYIGQAQNLATSFHKQMKKFETFYQANLEGTPIFARD